MIEACERGKSTWEYGDSNLHDIMGIAGDREPSLETQLADALAELKQLRQRVEAYNGFEPCDFKRLDSLNKQLEESAKGYKSLVPELLQLRKVRDAALKLKDSYGRDSQSKMQAWHEFVDALAQSKEVRS
jgi:hypothetical protein